MLRIAVAQTPGSRLDEWPKTHALVEELIAQAADHNVDIVVLPECVWPAYFIGSTDAYFEAREAGMPSDRWFLAQLTMWARAHRIAVCAGFIAEQERRLFNAASLISEAGEVLGTYYKCFLWDFDHAFFQAGSSIIPVNTRWGPVGLMICADARLPEIAATLVARGARLILQPTAWVNIGTPDALWNPQPELLLPERAREFGVPTASASKWGVEGQTTFVGSSLICDAAGNVLAQCDTGETKLAIAEVGLGAPRKPTLTSSQRTRLLTSEPAELPPADVPPLRVVAFRQRGQARTALSALQAGSSDTAPPTLLILAPAADDWALTADVHQGDNWLLLTGPTDGHQTLRAVRLAAVRDHDAIDFAPLRALTLSGVHLVVVFGESAPARTLRSRAAENRIFVVQVTPSEVIAYDPRGQRTGTTPVCTGPTPAGDAAAFALELDVAQAADKEFAPGTNPLLARTPGLYTF